MALFSQPTARVLAILDLLMAHPHTSFGLTEITRRLNLNKATCHAILTTMSTYGFLVQHPKTRGYRLGPSIIAAGNAALTQFPILEYARPELERLENELNLGYAVTGKSRQHMVLLALYGRATTLLHSFQLGLRLPNMAPIGAGFIAWAPAQFLEEWLGHTHEARGGYNEKLDQKFRVSVISIRARGYEVVLKTKAEQVLTETLSRIRDSWSLDALDDATSDYQCALCDETYHLDRIDPKARYNVSTISVPVLIHRELPAVCFVAGSIDRPISGAEIEHIAKTLQDAAIRVKQQASGFLDDS